MNKKEFTDIKRQGQFDGKPDAESVLPDDKPFITEEQLSELWDSRGMKYRIDEFHVALLNRGLIPTVDRPMFRQLVHDILRTFLVEGKARRDPRRSPRQRFPRYI
jgi:hypothetical protein